MKSGRGRIRNQLNLALSTDLKFLTAGTM